MRRSYARTAFGLTYAAVFMLFAGTALAADTSGYRTVDGVTVYYGVIPAEVLRTFPKGSPEATAHARIPGGKHVHHLVVAVFEGKDMTRITDAQVTARVRETGLGWTKKRLEPTTLNDALTFCNYFTFYDRTNYTIEINVRRPDAPAIVAAEFEYSN